ncbi:MAG: hypothetical protein IKT08_02800 [Bacteroidales bacterium]|nr:hypothetical protein [Bacteroidales bacterium]
MTTIQQEIIKQKDHLDFIHAKVDEGCQLFREDMSKEAEIAFSEAMQYSEKLFEEHPNERSYQVSLAETHHILSLAYSYIEKYDKAREHIHQAFSIYKGFHDNDRYYEFLLSSSLARIEHAAGNNHKTERILEKLTQSIEFNPFDEIDQEGYLYCSNILLLASTYFHDRQYQKAVEITRKVIELKRTNQHSFLNKITQDYLDLLNMAAYESAEQEDMDFHLFVLEEGLETCRQAMAGGRKVNPLCQGTFMQDKLKTLFFNGRKEEMKAVCEEMKQFCEEHVEDEPRLRKYKISGLLNYAVFCAKNGDSEEAEDLVCEAIDGCTEMDDDDGLEVTLFMVSALNILSNLQWEKGEHQGALSDLNSECKILCNYLSTHRDLAPSLSPLLFDLMLNRAKLHFELEQPEEGEAILENMKATFARDEEELQHPAIAPYLLTLKKIADLHLSLEEYDKARNEYHEVLYILDALQRSCPELEESIQSIADDIRNTLTSKAMIGAGNVASEH